MYYDVFDAGLREIMQCSAASELISRVWVQTEMFRTWGGK